MAQDSVSPGVGLVVAGVVDLLYGVIYALWTAMPLMSSGLIVVSQIMAITGVTQAQTTPGTVIFSVISAVAPLVQLAIYVLGAMASLVVIAGGARLISGGSKGFVFLAAVTAIAIPVIGLVANALSFCSVGSCGLCLFGFFGGSLGSLVPLVVAIPLGIWAIVTVRRPGYGGLDEDAA